jgi:hypothetical protein
VAAIRITSNKGARYCASGECKERGRQSKRERPRAGGDQPGPLVRRVPSTATFYQPGRSLQAILATGTRPWLQNQDRRYRPGAKPPA